MHLRTFEPDDTEEAVALFRDRAPGQHPGLFAGADMALGPDDIDVEAWRRQVLAHHTLVAELPGKSSASATSRTMAMSIAFTSTPTIRDRESAERC